MKVLPYCTGYVYTERYTGKHDVHNICAHVIAKLVKLCLFLLNLLETV
jgi:hypothetical protein